LRRRGRVCGLTTAAKKFELRHFPETRVEGIRGIERLVKLSECPLPLLDEPHIVLRGILSTTGLNMSQQFVLAALGIHPFSDHVVLVKYVEMTVIKPRQTFVLKC
jgi:hypothetical protein